jgi:hypothetical protein
VEFTCDGSAHYRATRLTPLHHAVLCFGCGVEQSGSSLGS